MRMNLISKKNEKNSKMEKEKVISFYSKQR